MSTNTPNYNLEKPHEDEFYNVDVPNTNMDKIDAALKALSDALGGIDLTNLLQAITAVDNKVNTHSEDKVIHPSYVIASGTNSYVATIDGIQSLVEGLSIKVKFTNANTGTVTLNINSLGAKTLLKSNGNSLSQGNIKAGQICHIVYTGSNFQLLGEGGEYGTARNSDVLKGKTIGTENGIEVGTLLPLTAGNYVISNVLSNPPTISNTTMTLVKQVSISGLLAESSIRVKLGFFTGVSSNTTYAQVYINGVPRGILRSNTTTTIVVYSEDFNVNNGDLIQIYMRSSVPDNNSYLSSFDICISPTITQR